MGIQKIRNGDNMNNTVAVVVTYNRMALLKENINALLSQTRACDVMIIDNASTDSTCDMVRGIEDDRIIYLNTGENLGGVGGFAYGVMEALKKTYKYIWIMDDDSIPDKKALESLENKAEALKNKFSFMSSLVYWTDGELFPMNMPAINYSNYRDAAPEIIRSHLLMPIKTGSFVGCFINTCIARKVGIPIADFFIYGDDIEYTTRLSSKLSAYLDLGSSIIHKAPSNKGADIVEATEDRIDRFFYQSRNGTYMARKKGMKRMIERTSWLIKKSGKIILASSNKKLKRLRVLYKGYFTGLFYNPEIEFVNEDNTNEG